MYRWSFNPDGRRSDFVGFGKIASGSDKAIKAYVAPSVYEGCVRLEVRTPTKKKMREALSRMKSYSIIKQVSESMSLVTTE